MLLKLQRYKLTIKYRPGKELYVADALSRNPSHLSKSRARSSHKLIQHVNYVYFTARTETRLILASQDDVTFNSLRTYISNGWPEHRRHLPQELRHCWPYRDELLEHNGLILKGQATLVPIAARRYIMEKLHAAHSGVQKMMYSSKQNVYWNGMRRDLENLVNKCEQCQQYAISPRRPPPTERERPSGPWQFLSSDLFYFKGNN